MRVTEFGCCAHIQPVIVAFESYLGVNIVGIILIGIILIPISEDIFPYKSARGS
jgi:hypothetical protein